MRIHSICELLPSCYLGCYLVVTWLLPSCYLAVIQSGSGPRWQRRWLPEGAHGQVGGAQRVGSRWVGTGCLWVSTGDRDWRALKGSVRALLWEAAGLGSEVPLPLHVELARIRDRVV